MTDVQLDAIRDHEVLVEIQAVGLCHTDLTVASGGLPFPLPGVLGHEGTGRVREIGSSVQDLSFGDRVVLSFTSCGRCEGCRSGHPAYCNRWLPDNLLSGRRADGTSPISQDGSPLGGHFFGQSSFAAYAVADERSCVRVETDLDPALLAPLGCGVQTGTGAVWNVLRPQLGQSIAVFGVGTVGLAAIMAARLSPATEIIAIDMVSSRLDLALKLGATRAIDASSTNDIVADVKEASGGGLHSALEATGNTRVLADAIASTREQGQVAIVGAPAFGSTVQVDVNAMMPGRRITGVTLGDTETQTSVPALVRLVEQGRLDVASLVQHYPLEEITTAIADMKSGTTIKPVLLP
ncbi:NAD(P)-dependent alcohol dehydrogenase [Micrococcaceae sp. AOP34-BR2-30]